MTDSRPAQERLREVVPEAPADKTAGAQRRGPLATGLALLAAGIAVFLVWQTVSSLLIIFAGVLFAALLDAAARAIAPIFPLSRAWRLTLVLVLLLVLSALGLAWGAGKIPDQIHLLRQVMETQLEVVQKHFLSLGVDLLGPEAGRDFVRWFFDLGRLLSNVQVVLGTATSFLTNALIILFLGILFAFDPQSYRESLVMLVKQSYRARTRAVLDEMGNVLRLWFIGQVIRIVLMTLCVWLALYLIGLPGPFVLGLQAGLSNFIPYLGPIVAAIPVALVAMPVGGSVLVWAVVIYTIIQSIEGYVIGPLIQRRAVATPAAWTLIAILLLGALFGVMGIALAMPLVAIGRVAIIRFYVEDYLGDDLSGSMAADANDEPSSTTASAKGYS
jgi:predicted PurR-regulated permease PerM